MKIALVSPYNMFRPGGVQSHIEFLAEELRHRHHKVKILAPGVNGDEPDKHDYVLLGSSFEMPFASTQVEVSYKIRPTERSISEFLKKEKFDVIHYHEPWVPFLSMQILSESKAANVGTFHATAPDTLFGKSFETITAPIANATLNALDAVIAVSQSPAKFIRSVYSGEIYIVPNGIELDVFHPKQKPYKEYMDHKVNILFLGRLDKRKGVKYLIKAFEKLLEKDIEARLLIAGKGTELEKLQAYVEKWNIPDVEFLGFVPEEDKPNWYATCDIYCSPALYGESFGIVLLEAMATKKPVVTTNITGYRSVIQGRGELLLVEPRDVEGLAEKLELLCKDEEVRKMMGEWGYEHAQQFSWKNVTSQIEEVYDKAIENKKRNR